MKTSSKVLNILQKSDSFLIVGHISPEGDSIGSSLALALGLKKLGKKTVTVVSKDPVPANLRFLPTTKTIKQKPSRKKYDLAVLVDCNEMKRTGFESFPAEDIIILDHHILPPDAGTSEFYRAVSASIIDPEAAAAGIVIHRVLSALKVEIDTDIATCLYAALLVDTGGFKYSNVSPEALNIASRLVNAGAEPWNISKEIYENVPFRSMKLLGTSLATLDRKDGIAWIVTTKEMFKETGTTSEDTEDFVNFPRKIQGIEVAVFIRQTGDDMYKLSLRSKGGVNVQKVAKLFDGGGHAAAAGCSVRGSLEEVKKQVFKELKKVIEETPR